MANQATGLYDPNTQQPVAITDIDLTNRRATAMTRRRSTIQVDLRYHVGGMQVTPAKGEQWFVTRSDSYFYRLVSKIPYNAPEMNTEPVEGMTQIGSSGPTVINGSVATMPPMQLPAYTTTGRPDADTFPAGTMIYDSTLHKPVFSDGSGWRDATGTPA
jgi:hypothetical protein